MMTLYICKLSNKLDLNQAICVSHRSYMDEHCSLLHTYINYGPKSFIKLVLTRRPHKPCLHGNLGPRTNP